jgi:membrane-bound lytic murein transglycosylase D
MGALKVLNPALRPPIWNGTRLVPRGYSLRLPGAPSESEIAAAIGRIPLNQRYVAQRNDGAHRARRGETLAGIAAASGVSQQRLLAANGWSATHTVARGELVRIPLPASRADVSGAAVTSAALAENPPPPPEAPAAPGSAQAAANAPPPGQPAVAQLDPAPAVVEKAVPASPKEPVSSRQADSAALLPAGPPSVVTDTTDYSVGAGNTVVVQVGETLGHFADWSGVDSAGLRALNKLNKNASVRVGKKIKLDLSKVSAAQFTAVRREYHQHLQEAFFSTHRIAGTESYPVKRGESLWTIGQQHSDLPVWLIAEYNPDVNFNDIKPGTTITLPKVVDINRQ